MKNIRKNKVFHLAEKFRRAKERDAEDVWCEEKKEKIRKNAKKYPVEKAYGHREKYNELGE
mgnify:CR=1 FL=1